MYQQKPSSTEQRGFVVSFPERVDEEMKVTNALKKNGYPDGMILRNSKLHSEVAQSEKSDEEEQPKATVILPYIRHVSVKFHKVKDQV